MTPTNSSSSRPSSMHPRQFRRQPAPTPARHDRSGRSRGRTTRPSSRPPGSSCRGGRLRGPRRQRPRRRRRPSVARSPRSAASPAIKRSPASRRSWLRGNLLGLDAAVAVPRPGSGRRRGEPGSTPGPPPSRRSPAPGPLLVEVGEVGSEGAVLESRPRRGEGVHLRHRGRSSHASPAAETRTSSPVMPGSSWRSGVIQTDDEGVDQTAGGGRRTVRARRPRWATLEVRLLASYLVRLAAADGDQDARRRRPARPPRGRRPASGPWSSARVVRIPRTATGAAAPSAPSWRGKRGQQVRRWLGAPWQTRRPPPTPSALACRPCSCRTATASRPCSWPTSGPASCCSAPPRRDLNPWSVRTCSSVDEVAVAGAPSTRYLSHRKTRRQDPSGR